jgi:protocatechuate 3,4-dioxygenase beta subunit
MVTSAEVTTDAAGRFQFRGLASGAYRVTFGAPTDPDYTRLDGVQVNTVYGANLLDLRLQSSSAGTLGVDEYQPNRLPHVIRGNVVDAGGAPVAGVRVRAQRQ